MTTKERYTWEDSPMASHQNAGYAELRGSIWADGANHGYASGLEANTSKLRDEFAKQAMMEMDWNPGPIEHYAVECYRIADAMLAARDAKE